MSNMIYSSNLRISAFLSV